jgi:hypothetical protein
MISKKRLEDVNFDRSRDFEQRRMRLDSIDSFMIQEFPVRRPRHRLCSLSPQSGAAASRHSRIPNPFPTKTLPLGNLFIWTLLASDTQFSGERPYTPCGRNSVQTYIHLLSFDRFLDSIYDRDHPCRYFLLSDSFFPRN